MRSRVSRHGAPDAECGLPVCAANFWRGFSVASRTPEAAKAWPGVALNAAIGEPGFRALLDPLEPGAGAAAQPGRGAALSWRQGHHALGGHGTGAGDRAGLNPGRGQDRLTARSSQDPMAPRQKTGRNDAAGPLSCAPRTGCGDRPTPDRTSLPRIAAASGGRRNAHPGRPCPGVRSWRTARPGETRRACGRAGCIRYRGGGSPRAVRVSR